LRQRYLGQQCDEAFVWLKVAAEKGHKEAQIAVGAQLLFGVGVEQNRELGVQYLDGAIGFENTIVRTYLTLWLLRCARASTPGEVVMVRKWMRKHCEDGDANAALYMALLIEGEKSSTPESREWYCVAAERNVFLAMYFLTTEMVDQSFKAEVLDNLGRFGITSSSLASLRETLGYDDSKFPKSVFFLKSALAGYGPAILEVCYDSLHIQNFKREHGRENVEMWLRKGIHHPQWYIIKGKLYREVSYLIYRLYQRRDYRVIDNAQKQKDDLLIISDLNF